MPYNPEPTMYAPSADGGGAAPVEGPDFTVAPDTNDICGNGYLSVSDYVTSGGVGIAIWMIVTPVQIPGTDNTAGASDQSSWARITNVGFPAVGGPYAVRIIGITEEGLVTIRETTVTVINSGC